MSGSPTIDRAAQADEFHAEAHGALADAVARRGERLVIPVPALIEAYAVMTRLPAAHRLAPVDAIALLSAAFERRAGIVGLTGKETWRFLHAAAEGGIAGGRTYDGLILWCALKAGARRLLTLDPRDFERLEPTGIEIVVPA